MASRGLKLPFPVRLGVSIAILIGSGLVLIGLSGLRADPEKKEGTDLLRQLVIVETVVKHDQNLVIETNGLVVPFKEIRVAAEVSGRITMKAPECQAGTFVKKGTKLLEIDSTEFQLEVDRLTAEVDQAKSQISELDSEITGVQKMVALAKKDVEIAQRELKRLEKSRNVVSSSELDQTRKAFNGAQNVEVNQSNQLQVLTSRKSRLKSGLDLANAKLRKADFDLKRATVIAPESGVIVAESVQQDDFVQKGSPLLIFEDTSAAEVRISLRNDQLMRIQDSMPREPKSSDDQGVNPYRLPPLKSKITYSMGEGEHVWEGELSRFDGIGLDEQTRSAPCLIHIDNPIEISGAKERALVRGMYVNVKLEVQQTIPLLRIPSVAQHAGGTVWGVIDVEQVETTKKDDTKEESGEELGEESNGSTGKSYVGKLKRFEVEVVQSYKSSESEELWAVYMPGGKAPKVDQIIVRTPLVEPLEGELVQLENWPQKEKASPEPPAKSQGDTEEKQTQVESDKTADTAKDDQKKDKIERS